MPFRSKLKRALGGGNSSNPSSDTSSLNKTTTTTSSKTTKPSKLPDNVYKPGEPMPRPKYRGPWNQAHQDKLSAFRFGSFSSNNGGDRNNRKGAGMMRRKSSGEASARAGSEYSPMGSKLPSRGPSRRGSAWSGFSVGGMGSRKHTQEQQQQQQRRDSGGVGLDEVEGDGGDVGNVGLSRQHTAEGKPPPQQQQQTQQSQRHTTFQTQPPVEGTPHAAAGTVNDLQPSRTIVPPPPPPVNGGGHHHHPQDGTTTTTTTTGTTTAGTTGPDLQTQRTITNGAGSAFTADELAVAMSRSGIQDGGKVRGA